MSEKDTLHVLKQGFQKNEKLIVMDEKTLAKLKLTLKEMLEDFIYVAEKYSLHYTMSGGSVLGTVRHQGFIPWDDDIDINIPREDYNIFLKVFEKELGSKYIILDPYTSHNHGMTLAQMKKKGTVYRSFNELSKERADCGICIDLFIIENTFDNCFLRNVHGILCLAFGYATTCKKTSHDIQLLDNYLEKGTKAEMTFKKKAAIGKLFFWISLDRLVRVTIKCYSLCKNNHSKYVTIPTGRKHFFHEMHLREELCESVEMPFEDIMVKIPKGYKAYLTSLYGEDYMSLPPSGKRENHPLMEIDFGESI